MKLEIVRTLPKSKPSPTVFLAKKRAIVAYLNSGEEYVASSIY